MRSYWGNGMQRVPIAQVAGEPSTWNPKGSASNEPFRYIDISSIDPAEKRIRTVVTIAPAEAPSRARQLVRSGDVLVSTVRPNLNAVAVVPDDLDGATASTGFTVLRPDMASVDPRYLYYWVRSPKFVSEMTARATGASYPAVTEGVVRDSRLPLPPLAEQRRIAAVLDRADAIRRKRRESLRLLDEFLRSAFLEMFGDPVRNPKSWRTGTLGDLIEGPENGLYRPASDYGTGTPIVRIDSFYDGEITAIEALKRVRLSEDAVAKYALQQDDILINRVNSREFLGKSAVVPTLKEPTVFESNMMRLRVDMQVVHPRYLVSLLQTPYFKRQVLRRTKDAVNQASINQDDVRSFEIRIPPLELQNRFVSLLDRVAGVRKLFEALIEQTESLFDSLAQRAFRGEL